MYDTSASYTRWIWERDESHAFLGSYTPAAITNLETFQLFDFDFQQLH